MLGKPDMCPDNALYMIRHAYPSKIPARRIFLAEHIIGLRVSLARIPAVTAFDPSRHRLAMS